jgi:hypothetical protein
LRISGNQPFLIEVGMDELCCLVSGIDADLNIAHLGLPASQAHPGTRTKGLKPVESATMRYLQS